MIKNLLYDFNKYASGGDFCVFPFISNFTLYSIPFYKTRLPDILIYVR